MFEKALDLQVVCLGLYRNKKWETGDPALDVGVLINSKEDYDLPPSSRAITHRFVYTNPSPAEQLFDDDLVFVLAPNEKVQERWNELLGNLGALSLGVTALSI